MLVATFFGPRRSRTKLLTRSKPQARTVTTPDNLHHQHYMLRRCPQRLRNSIQFMDLDSTIAALVDRLNTAPMSTSPTVTTSAVLCLCLYGTAPLTRPAARLFDGLVKDMRPWGLPMAVRGENYR